MRCISLEKIGAKKHSNNATQTVCGEHILTLSPHLLEVPDPGTDKMGKCANSSAHPVCRSDGWKH
eukprot:scaffold128178_cov12-Tisochrysis_lutea.AAC.1